MFNCFILPIFLYSSHIWLTRLSKSTINSLNTLFTKFLKRYFCVPRFSNNEIIYFLSNTSPLHHQITSFVHSHPLKAGFPSSFSGIQLIFSKLLPNCPDPFSPLHLIPSSFWLSPVLHTFSLNPSHRRAMVLPVLSPYFPIFDDLKNI